MTARVHHWATEARPQAQHCKASLNLSRVRVTGTWAGGFPAASAGPAGRRRRRRRGRSLTGLVTGSGAEDSSCDMSELKLKHPRNVHSQLAQFHQSATIIMHMYHVHTCWQFRKCTYTYTACMPVVYVHTSAFDIGLCTMYIHVCTCLIHQLGSESRYRIPDHDVSHDAVTWTLREAAQPTRAAVGPSQPGPLAVSGRQRELPYAY